MFASRLWRGGGFAERFLHKENIQYFDLMTCYDLNEVGEIGYSK